MNCLHCSEQLEKKEEVQVKLTMLTCPCCDSVVFVLKEEDIKNDDVIERR
tara:strand:- start:3366 stop:3515 length:150 start_codon:yes stop_codon:yes gene_type:complete